jgi:hypothetical protein
MVQSTYDVNINIKTQDKSSGAIKKSGNALASLGKAATVAGAAMLTLKAGMEAIKFAQFGGEVQRAADSLHFLAKGAGESSSEIVRHMQGASGYTIDRMSAMSAANKALLLDVAKTPAQFAELSKQATLLGRAMGQDAAKSIDDFIVAAGRQSKPIADNLGLMVSAEDANRKYAARLGKTAEQLTDAEKKQAFLNEMLVQARAKTDDLEKSSGGLATQNEQLKAQFLDLKANAAQVWASFVEGTGIVEALADILWTVNHVMGKVFPETLGRAEKATKSVEEATRDVGKTYTEILGPIKTLATTQKELFEKEAAGLATAADMREIHRIRIKEAVEQGAEDQLNAMEKLMLLEQRRTEVAKENSQARIEMSVKEAQAAVKASVAGGGPMSLQDAIKTARTMSSFGISNEEVNAFLQLNSAQRNAQTNAQRDAQIRLDRAQRFQQITNQPNYYQTINTTSPTVRTDFALESALAGR